LNFLRGFGHVRAEHLWWIGIQQSAVQRSYEQPLPSFGEHEEERGEAYSVIGVRSVSGDIISTGYMAGRKRQILDEGDGLCSSTVDRPAQQPAAVPRRAWRHSPDKVRSLGRLAS